MGVERIMDKWETLRGFINEMISIHLTIKETEVSPVSRRLQVVLSCMDYLDRKEKETNE